jgi:hypothetical protein
MMERKFIHFCLPSHSRKRTFYVGNALCDNLKLVFVQLAHNAFQEFCKITIACKVNHIYYKATISKIVSLCQVKSGSWKYDATVTTQKLFSG